jgi:hypothetical protein
MIRIFFTMLLAVAALIGLSLRLVRDADTRPALPGAQIAELRTVDLGRSQPEPAPSEPAAPDALIPEEASPEEAAPDESPREEPLDVEIAAPAAFVEADDSAAIAAGDTADAALLVTAAVDQDEWAALIRRMLSVYRRTVELE